jgi:hypothetical protein
MSKASSSQSPFVERLPCKLSTQELALRADELARTVNTRDSIALEKSLSAQRFSKSIKEADRKIVELAEMVTTGCEYRQVRVCERRDFSSNVVEIVRLDTHEVCGQRAMRAEERQEEMAYKPTADDRQLALGEAEAVAGDGEEPLGPDDDDDEDDDFDDEEIDAEQASDTH